VVDVLRLALPPDALHDKNSKMYVISFRHFVKKQRDGCPLVKLWNFIIFAV